MKGTGVKAGSFFAYIQDLHIKSVTIFNLMKGETII